LASVGLGRFLVGLHQRVVSISRYPAAPYGPDQLQGPV
jgi:hypothetical protein